MAFFSKSLLRIAWISLSDSFELRPSFLAAKRIFNRENNLEVGSGRNIVEKPSPCGG